MRCIRLFLYWALTLPLFLHAAQADDTRDYKQAEKLALEERYEEAVAAMMPIPSDSPNRRQALQGLCMAYSLWGEKEEAKATCAKALRDPLYAPALKCGEDALRGGSALYMGPKCNAAPFFEDVAYLKTWQALAYYEKEGEHWSFIPEASDALLMAVFISTFREFENVLSQSVRIYFTDQYEFNKAPHPLGSKEREIYEKLHVILTYGPATNPPARAWRLARVFYAEHPYGKKAPYAAGVVIGLVALLALVMGPMRPMLTRLPRSINAWLRPSARSATLYSPAAAAAPAPAPGVPLYYTMRYPNQAYRIAGYCFATFWIVLLGPLALALLLPALTLLVDFSVSGFQKAYGHFFGILTTSVTWARLWFALLFFSLLGFVGFKLYGRFSLPKPMRPPIRFVYGTLVFAFLSTILTAVGTFLAYFTAAFTGLYSNPLVKTLVNIIRKLLGF